jgi:hypothetical protein
MPNTKAVGVAYSDPEFESVTVTGAVAAASVSATGNLTADSGTAPAAGGMSAILVSSTAGLGVYVGSGAPTVSAAQGSIYLRTDGSSTSTRLYVNTNGSTTWTNVTTAA